MFDNILRLCNATKRSFYSYWNAKQSKIEALYRSAAPVIPPPAPRVSACIIIPMVYSIALVLLLAVDLRLLFR